MSATVAIRIMGGAAAEETANFIEMVDKLFDCLNVSLLSDIYFCYCSFLKKSYFLTLISGKQLYRRRKDTRKKKLI